MSRFLRSYFELVTKLAGIRSIRLSTQDPHCFWKRIIEFRIYIATELSYHCRKRPQHYKKYLNIS